MVLHFHFHAWHIVRGLFETNDMNLWSLLTKNIMLMGKRILSSIGLFLLCMQVIAQTRTITGKITDENGVGISNASVRAKETSIGTTTDINGSFSLSLPPGAQVLVISSVGYAAQEVSLANRSTFNLSLQKDDQKMQEVVVVAYGTAKKGAVTNSVAQITSKELENRPVTNVISALAGMAPGITTTTASGQPGSSGAVSIRGYGSMSSSNAPLYVVDGVPYDYDISNINVDDIENVSILKDAAASALYGARAANGVIQITTKKGRKDRTQVQANIAQGFISRALPEYDRIDAFQYYPIMWEGYRNSLVYPASTTTPALNIDSANKIASGLMPRQTTGNNAGLQIYNGRFYSDIKQLVGYNPFNVGNTEIIGTNGALNSSAKLLWADDLDWLKDIQRNGNRGDYTVSVSGGAPKTDYYFSLGYTNEKGYVLNSDYKRYSGRLNLNTQPFEFFKTGLSLAGIVTQANQGASDASSTGLVNPFYASRIIAPIYPVYVHDPTTGAYELDANGNRVYDLGNLGSRGAPYANRPIAGGRHAIYETILNQNILKRNVLNTRLYGEISFLKNFKFTTNITADISNSLRSQAENRIVGDGAPSGRSRRNAFDNLTMTINQLLNFNRSFGSHSVELLAGHETFDGTYKTLTNLRTGQVFEGITELANYTTTSSLTSYTDRYKIESFLSRANYNFDNKYFISGSLRRDGTSRFAPENRWGNFWSVGAAWRLDREGFMKIVPVISALKLRSSYGLVGNDAIIEESLGAPVYYAYQNFYNLGNNNNAEPGAVPSRDAGNPNLKWEVNSQFDIALEFGLFKSRLNGTLEYFNRKSSNLLFRVPPPVSSGALTLTQNIGAMYNKGIEVNLNGDILRNKDFTWNMGINWTTFKNKITKLPENTPTIPANTFTVQQWEVGHSRYEFWVRDWYGVDPSDGAGLFVANAWNVSNSRVIKNGNSNDTVTTDQNNAKFHYEGSAVPDFYGSILSNFSFKGFGLAFQLNYQVGGLVYDATYAQLMHAGTYGTALHPDILRRWQKPGDITDVPRMDAGRTSVYGASSDRWLISATHLNVQNVTLSYTLPKSLLSRAYLQNTRVYVSGENIYMFSKRKGMNPSQSFANQVLNNSGVTQNVYSPSRTITAGINLTF